MQLQAKVVSLAVTLSNGIVEPRQSIQAALEGIVDDRHSGFVRKSDGRETGIKRGTPTRNWRQWSAVSVEELQKIAKELGLDELDPDLLSANITFGSVDNFTQTPRGTTIWFPSGCVLSVECENAPCINPGKKINAVFPAVKPHQFPKVAIGMRGLVGVVYKAGSITVGDIASLKMPN